MQTYTDTQTHTQTYTDTHTQTHTHTYTQRCDAAHSRMCVEEPRKLEAATICEEAIGSLNVHVYALLAVQVPKCICQLVAEMQPVHNANLKLLLLACLRCICIALHNIEA